MLTKLNRTIQMNKKYYQILCVYWLLLPVLFISYLLLKANIESVGIQWLLTSNPFLAIMLLISLITPFSSLFLLKLSNAEKSCSKSAFNFLQFGFVQQLLVGNLIGAALCFLALKEIKYSGQKETAKMKELAIIIAFEVIFTVIALFAMAMLLKNS